MPVSMRWLRTQKRCDKSKPNSMRVVSIAMPRFFFPVSDGRQTVADMVGLVCARQSDAIAQAKKIASELAVDAGYIGCEVEVLDAQGKLRDKVRVC